MKNDDLKGCKDLHLIVHIVPDTFTVSFHSHNKTNVHYDKSKVPNIQTFSTVKKVCVAMKMETSF